MTGLRGLLLTSATGAKLTCTPSARASRPVRRAASRTSDGIAGGAERHRARKARGAVDAHADAVFEVGADEERRLRTALQTVEDGGQFERLAEDGGPVGRVQQHRPAPARRRRRRTKPPRCTSRTSAASASNAARVGADVGGVEAAHDELPDQFVVGQNLVRNSDCKVPVTIKVIDTDEPNAMALPGGFFFVNTGLVTLAENEAEIAGVMGHEIAHIAARHGTRQATRGQIANLATIPLIFMGGWAGYGIRQAASILIPMGFLQVLPRV